MTSQLTNIAASQHRADLYATAANSRRAADAPRPVRTRRPSRRWPRLRRRPAVA